MAHSAVTNSNWSEIWHFTTKMAAPFLISPADSSDIYDARVVLKWSPVSPDTSFWVQVATDIEFGDIIFEGPSGKDTFLVDENLEPGKSYFWRVQAWNEKNEGYWSETRMFTTNNIPTGVYDILISGLGLKMYPVPFRDLLRIEFTLSAPECIMIYALDERGRTADVITEKYFNSGRHILKWEPKNQSRGAYYIYVIIGGKSVIVEPVVLESY